MTLEQLKKLAETNPMKLVTLHRKKSNPKTEKVIWDTIEVIATVAYNNLRKPYDQKLSGWKKIYLERDSLGSIEEEFVFTKNSLSNPNLIEQLKEAGFVKVEATKPEPIPVAEKSLSDFSDAELLEYLKSKGSIHGKVKLKGEEEIESNLTDPQ
jgi:ribosomal protein S24E